jgi:iron complex transport system ATP-binding protein
LTYGYSSAPVFENISVDFSKNLNVIIGPNAAGKSTLLKCLFGLLKAQGNIAWKGKDILRMPHDERADIMAYLPQDDIPPTSLTVFETVLLGRLFSLKWKVVDADREKVYSTLESLHIETLAERCVAELSGGQRKLVSIAQTLIRDPDIILMDEPVNSLDMQKQIELFDIIHQIINVKNIMFVIVMHDINLSSKHADQLTILDGGGNIFASGKPQDIVTRKMLRDVYSVEADITHDKNGIPVVIPNRSLNYLKYCV